MRYRAANNTTPLCGAIEGNAEGRPHRQPRLDRLSQSLVPKYVGNKSKDHEMGGIAALIAQHFQPGDHIGRFCRRPTGYPSELEGWPR